MSERVLTPEETEQLKDLYKRISFEARENRDSPEVAAFAQNLLPLVERFFGPRKAREIFVRFDEDGSVCAADLEQGKYLGRTWHKFREVLSDDK